MNDAPIPPDIRERAEITNRQARYLGLSPVGAVARGMVAERQRCIDLAEIEMKVNLSDRIPAELANQVLEAIRKGSS